jgi:nicotinamidase-related amidase
MLLDVNDSLLLIVDMQEKLIPTIFEHHKLIQSCVWTLELAQDLSVPVLVSEQYPQGLGRTVKPLLDLISTSSFMQKKSFSCCADPNCLQMIKQSKKKQIVMVGIEAHVCVMQTALELTEQQKKVFIVVDAISSRHAEDKTYALQRMRSANIQIITREMLFFEWLRTSANERFKELSKRYIT